MTTNYKKLLKDYPQYLSLDQMRIVCHISKKTARILLQNGLVPCENTGKKTHSYKIKKTDIINFLIDRDTSPEKYILLEGRYAKDQTSAISPTDGANFEPIDQALLEEYPDLLSVEQAAKLSGVAPDTVKDWAKNKHLKAFIRNNAYRIPKLSLLEYLDSPRHRCNSIMKQNNLAKRRESSKTKN